MPVVKKSRLCMFNSYVERDPNQSSWLSVASPRSNQSQGIGPLCSPPAHNYRSDLPGCRRACETASSRINSWNNSAPHHISRGCSDKELERVCKLKP